MVTKREFPNTADLSVFKSVFVPILTYVHESWVMIERGLSQVMLSQVQAAEMDFSEMFTTWHFATKCTQ